MGKIKVSLTIDGDIYAQFKEYCARNGMKVSTKVEIMMQEAMKDKSLNQYL